MPALRWGVLDRDGRLSRRKPRAIRLVIGVASSRLRYSVLTVFRYMICSSVFTLLCRLVTQQRSPKVISMRWLLTLGLFFCPLLAFAEPAVLQGGVSLSDSLPPVPKAAMPGQQYSASAVTDSFKSLDDWRRVPKWNVGTFHVESEIQQTLTGMTEFVARSDVTHGDMRDALGHYWELIVVPRTAADIDDAETTQHNFVTFDESVEIGPSVVSRKLRYISIIVDKRSGRVLEAVQQEDLATATPHDRTSYKVLSKRRVFSPTGKFITEITSVKICNRTGEFRPKMELEKSFRQFLLAQGRSDLIPDEMKVADDK